MIAYAWGRHEWDTGEGSEMYLLFGWIVESEQNKLKVCNDYNWQVSVLLVVERITKSE